MLRSTSKHLQPKFNSLPSFVPSIWVAGLNWHSHATEVGFPIPQQPIFCMKSPTSLLYPQSYQHQHQLDGTFCGKFGNKIFVPKMIQVPAEVDYEGELAVVIGQRIEQGALSSKEEVVKNQDQIISGFCFFKY